MLRASIDLGTNTCLLLLADWDPIRREVSRVVQDHSTIVRLGQGVDRTRTLAPEAIDRTLECLKRYSKVARDGGLDPAQAICAATASARDSTNGAEFFARVEKETGFRFRTLSGDEEALYTFRGGLLAGMNPRDSAVIDIGGGSTELMAESGGESINMGAVRFTERFLKSDPVTDEQFWACQEEIDRLLEPLKRWRQGLSSRTQLVGVAGTATTLGAWHAELKTWDASKVDEVTLTRGDVHRMVEELKWRTVAERCELPGVEKGRADVLLAGSLILWRTLELLVFPTVRISTRGLRYGILDMPSHG